MDTSSDITEKAINILLNYLTQNKYRKTPERFAILKAAYSFEGFFTTDDISSILEKDHFHVSLATIYNTLNLLMEIKLVSAIRINKAIRYKAEFTGDGCYSVCTLCGQVTKISSPEVDEIFRNVRTKRFRKENYTFSIYGICSKCQGALTRKNNKRKNKE